MRRAFVFVILVLILLGCSRHAGPTLPVEAISARMGPEVIDPHTRLLEVTTRLAPRGKYSSRDFSLTYWEGDSNPMWKGGQNTTWPLSIVAAGQLFDLGNGLESKEWAMETQDKTLNIDLVFVVPVDLGQTTLLYKNQPAGKPLSIAR